MGWEGLFGGHAGGRRGRGFGGELGRGARDEGVSAGVAEDEGVSGVGEW